MAVVQASGETIELNYNQYNTLYRQSSVNKITGSVGPTQVKLNNTSPYDIGTIAWQKTNVTDIYPFLPTTTNHSGHNATFTVWIDYNLIQIFHFPNIAEGDYAIGDTLTISGTEIGGTSPLNDIHITVTSVNNGKITSFTFTYNVNNIPWPQTFLGTTNVSPLATEYLQIQTSTDLQDMYFRDISNLQSGSIFVATVTVVNG